MIYGYQGHYRYNKVSITNNAPESIGVYYCGYLDMNNLLIPCYVGRAKGDYVDIRSRLSDHLRDDSWSDVTHFGFSVCSTAKDAEDLEAKEIERCQPKYNIQGK